ncbi:Hypothetical predicted protein [Olea europaea subsp. europaea]|uniref:Uncharacterized protein n=1 Tax=Olea europaea subsp. europaea TaxID=158383 RepID=A0A8S0Q3G0_OLEEU|nr:Hypothetical predicted protein [Olea europaea subsp. europaea]
MDIIPIRSSMDPPMEPDKMYVESQKDEGASAHMSPPNVAYTADFETLKMVLTRNVDPKSWPNIGESSRRKAQKRKSMKGSKVSMPDSGSGTLSKSRIHGRKVQDINPSEIEMVQSYMDGVLYNKPQQPSLSRHSQSSDIEIDDDDDDDFVDQPLRRQWTSFPSVLPWTLR